MDCARVAIVVRDYVHMWTDGDYEQDAQMWAEDQYQMAQEITLRYDCFYVHVPRSF